MRLLDLFSGIGGFSLGLERSGAFKTVAFCEIDRYCRGVLKKHWPEIPCYEDIRTLTGDTLRRDGLAVDAICGGFPCQDVSTAGKRAGIEASRSGLWDEYARLISELRPEIVIVENVTGLLSAGFGRVLGKLAALGYDAVWDCIPACAVGAGHRRDRVWIIAYPTNAIRRTHSRCVEGCEGASRREEASGRIQERVRNSGDGRPSEGAWWATEPDLDRVVHGVPIEMDRQRALGNAVVPQIPEIIGEAIARAFSHE